MNYRHAFHAGNHTEVFKHAALVFVLEHLLQKPQPFMVLDTHAGLGTYDLTSIEAQKTGEFEQGAARVFGGELAAAPAYLDLLAAMNPEGLRAYPGSPEIVRRMLREDDRLVACELHPADAELLKRRYRDDARVAVHYRDGYEAIGAFTPPPERRGLVFIDPPYEEKDEGRRLAGALTAGLKALRAEFLIRPQDGLSLAGGGLLVCNAPWRLDERLNALCEELSPLLGDGAASGSVEWLTQA
jgi:23S rRNA (adenine2030-N6)-methyltransferase